MDFRQSYDSISRNKIFEIKNYLGITTILVRLISATIENAKTCAKVHNNWADHFEVNRGMKQGKWTGTSLM
jgi:hypothetical protein